MRCRFARWISHYQSDRMRRQPADDGVHSRRSSACSMLPMRPDRSCFAGEWPGGRLDGRTSPAVRSTGIGSSSVLIGIFVLARSSSGIFRPRFVRGNLGTHEQPFRRHRERLAGGAGGGYERPCSPARCRRNLQPGCPPQATDISSASRASAARAHCCQRGI